jgi:zinc D-Ala-D-Ala carboxypeptidase
METHKLIWTLEKILIAITVLIVFALAGAGAYGYLRLNELSAQVDELNFRLSSTTDQFAIRIDHATSTLSDQIKLAQQKVQTQFGSITGTVTTLEKLSQTDRELLAKYSKVFFLSDNYAPARLAEIPLDYRYNEKISMQVIPEVLPSLKKMLDQAREDDVELYVQSAYRSFTEQTVIKDAYTFSYGAGTANTFSADQGYSEHQLGTTIDLISTGTKGKLEGFDKTPAFAWVKANAHKYGFVLSYPKNNGYYVYEPWHWRFVGVKLATYLHEEEKYFYELDQRTIDTYLATMFA